MKNNEEAISKVPLARLFINLSSTIFERICKIAIFFIIIVTFGTSCESQPNSITTLFVTYMYVLRANANKNFLPALW